MRTMQRIVAMALCAAALGGCASFERKFIPKSKREKKPPTPVVHFKSYDQTESVQEAYQRRLMLWDFWNDELVGGFGVNEKKAKRSSQETLAQLVEMQRFLPEELARQMQTLIDAHRQMDARIQQGDLNESTAQVFKRQFEAQEREVYRRFSLRQLKDVVQRPQDVMPVPTVPPPPPVVMSGASTPAAPDDP